MNCINSITKHEDGLYSMTYIGDYGFDDFIKEGGAKTDGEVGSYLEKFIPSSLFPIKTRDQGCSTIKGKSIEGDELFGRNFDWEKCTTMIVKTYPKNGYSSISTCNMEYLGFGENYKPNNFRNKLLAIAAIYVPLDGMNEKGLCIADLIIDTKERTNQSRGKTNLTTTTAIRLLLDKCATVDEAISLLHDYDMHTSADMMHHIAISDANGKSVVVEYYDNVMHVTETKAVTNFYLTQGSHYRIGSQQSKDRYDTLMKADANGKLKSEIDIKNALKSVSQTEIGEEFEITAWSWVYNQTKKTCEFYFRENWSNSYKFSL